MIYYRALKKTDPLELKPLKTTHAYIDLIYSNELPSHITEAEQRVVWSFAKTPEAAMKWLLKDRGKDQYNRLAWYDFSGDEGTLFDLTDIKTWIGLMAASPYFPQINNINHKGAHTIDAVATIIPCSRSARSMAREAQEVVFIPTRSIRLNLVDNNNPDLAPVNDSDAIDITDKFGYTNEDIDKLLIQLKKYKVRPFLQNELEKLKLEKKVFSKE